MLGLGASHLALMLPDSSASFSKAALCHRITAIQSLNEFLSEAHLTQVNADVAFGTMLALTFQASHLRDGLVEYLTMVRGCKSNAWPRLYVHPTLELSFSKPDYHMVVFILGRGLSYSPFAYKTYFYRLSGRHSCNGQP